MVGLGRGSWITREEGERKRAVKEVTEAQERRCWVGEREDE